MFVNIGQIPFKFHVSNSKTCCSSCQQMKVDVIPASSSAGARALFDLYRNYRQIAAQCASALNNPISNKEIVFDAVDLESSTYETSQSLEALGLDHLKAELQRRGLKVGGSLGERAARLLAVRGIPEERIDPKLKPKAK